MPPSREAAETSWSTPKRPTPLRKFDVDKRCAGAAANGAPNGRRCAPIRLNAGPDTQHAPTRPQPDWATGRDADAAAATEVSEQRVAYTSRLSRVMREYYAGVAPCLLSANGGPAAGLLDVGRRRGRIRQLNQGSTVEVPRTGPPATAGRVQNPRECGPGSTPVPRRTRARRSTSSPSRARRRRCGRCCCARTH